MKVFVITGTPSSGRCRPPFFSGVDSFSQTAEARSNKTSHFFGIPSVGSLYFCNKVPVELQCPAARQGNIFIQISLFDW
jgi:hypothetical protein